MRKLVHSCRSTNFSTCLWCNFVCLLIHSIMVLSFHTYIVATHCARESFLCRELRWSCSTSCKVFQFIGNSWNVKTQKSRALNREKKKFFSFFFNSKEERKISVERKNKLVNYVKSVQNCSVKCWRKQKDFCKISNGQWN